MPLTVDGNKLSEKDLTKLLGDKQIAFQKRHPSTGTMLEWKYLNEEELLKRLRADGLDE